MNLLWAGAFTIAVGFFWLIWRLSRPRWAYDLPGPSSWDIFWGARGECMSPLIRAKALQRWSKEFGSLFYVKGMNPSNQFK